MKNSNIKFIHNLTDALGRSEKQPIDDEEMTERMW